MTADFIVSDNVGFETYSELVLHHGIIRQQS